MGEGQTDTPPPARKLLFATLGAAAAATTLVVLVVMPAEFGRDPTGFGRVTGLSKLSSHAEPAAEAASSAVAAALSYDRAFRSDLIEVPLVKKGDRAGYFELEYKVAMKKGQSFVYSWAVDAAPGAQLYSDLHAETPKPDARVIEFKQEDALASNGTLIAPVDGVYGWYWLNKSTGPVTVRLRLAGFYDLILPGAPGNAAGLEPSLPEAATSSTEASTIDE